jgi:hypothetical protein
MTIIRLNPQLAFGINVALEIWQEWLQKRNTCKGFALIEIIGPGDRLLLTINPISSTNGGEN